MNEMKFEGRKRTREALENKTVRKIRYKNVMRQKINTHSKNYPNLHSIYPHRKKCEKSKNIAQYKLFKKLHIDHSIKYSLNYLF